MDALTLALARAEIRRLVFKSKLHDFEFITKFQPGHGWNVDTDGTVSESTEFPMFGSQSIKFTKSTSGNTGAVGKSNLSIDLSRHTLVVWVRRTGNSLLNIYAGDNTLANYYFWNAGGLTPLRGVGEWEYYLLPLQGASVTGSPNKANITRVRITGNIADDLTPIYLGAIALVKNSVRYPHGVISLTWDDELIYAYNSARPIMDRYGYGGTGYVIANTVGTGSNPTLTQLHRMEDLHGWEIGGHAYAQHVDWTTLTQTDLETEVNNLRNWLLQNRFRGADHLAYPYGATNEAVKQAVRNAGFYSARMVANGERNALPPEPARLHALNAWNIDDPLATTLSRIDLVAQHQGWGVFMCHSLDAGGLTSADFVTILDRIQSLGIAVAPVGDVLGTWDPLRP